MQISSRVGVVSRYALLKSQTAFTPGGKLRAGSGDKGAADYPDCAKTDPPLRVEAAMAAVAVNDPRKKLRRLTGVIKPPLC